MNDETFFGKRAITICRREKEFHIEQRANADQLKNTQVFSAESLQNDVRPTLVHIVTKSVKMFGLYPPNFCKNFSG